MVTVAPAVGGVGVLLGAGGLVLSLSASRRRPVTAEKAADRPTVSI
jgi:hypothetical protein